MSTQSRSIPGMKTLGGVRDLISSDLRDLSGVISANRRWGGGWSGAISNVKDYFGGSGNLASRLARRDWRGPLGGQLKKAFGSYTAYASNMRKGLGLARKVGWGGAALGTGIGISMATGYSVFDQAQAVGGGYLGMRAGRNLGFGRFGTGAAMAAGAFTGQALGAQEWMLGGLGHSAVRGAQALGVGKWLTGKYGWTSKFGGGRARAIGAGIGVGLGLLL